MKLNIRLLSAFVAASAAIAVLPAVAATGTAFTQDPFGAVDQPLKAISQPAPVYSTYLRHASVEGNVVVSFEVNSKGQVVNPVIVRSTDRLFDEPTLRAIASWRYIPAVKDGRPVNTRVNELVQFRITD
jgi:periplasmic protein TonB